MNQAASHLKTQRVLWRAVKNRRFVWEEVWGRRITSQIKELLWGFPGGSVVKTPPANVRNTSLIPDLGRSTCLGATKPVSHICWACALGPGNQKYWVHILQLLKPVGPRDCALQQERLPQWEVLPPQLESSPCLLQLEKSLHRNEDPAQPQMSKWINKSKAVVIMDFFKIEDSTHQ